MESAAPVGIFLSHGYTATTAEIRPMAEIFHAQGYTVAAPLLPGHGTQPEDLNRVHWQDWVAHRGRIAAETVRELRASLGRGRIDGRGAGACILPVKHPNLAGILLYAPAIRLTMSKMDLAKTLSWLRLLSAK